jgi:hypothetical protein
MRGVVRWLGAGEMASEEAFGEVGLGAREALRGVVKKGEASGATGLGIRGGDEEPP